MKRFSTLALWILLTTAQASQLHTVTVNLVPNKTNGWIFLINTDKDSSGNAGCDEELVNTITCQLPSGNYELVVHDPDDNITFFPTIRRYIIINKDTVIQQKLALGFKSTPSLPADVIKAFDSLKVVTNAKTANCPFGNRPTRLCAISPLSLDAVQKIFSSSQELKQTRGWDTQYNIWSGDFETISEDSYGVSLIKYDQSVFIQLFTWD